jgi:hypothetical protein
MRWLRKWGIAIITVAALMAGAIYLLSQKGIDFDTVLNYFALGLLIFVVITLFYGIIAIHDVPYEIAKKRGHPHQDAIHAAGWVSLFTLHAIWPFLWIWAMLYRPERGWGFEAADGKGNMQAALGDMEDILRRLAILEAGQQVEDRASYARRLDEIEKRLRITKPFHQPPPPKTRKNVVRVIS